jgi:4-hydroxy-tetrahydrodipicolinate synthase
MVELFLAGDLDEARTLQFAYLPLIQALFEEPNPVPVKAAVKAMGFDVGDVRLPLLEIGEEAMRQLRSAMRAAGVENRVAV